MNSKLERPTTKWTADKVAGLLTAAVILVGAEIFDVDLRGSELPISMAVGWVVGGIWSYFATETNPASSSIPYLPPEVSPDRG